MRHRVAHRKLGRVTEHRIAMLRNQAERLIQFEHLQTTVPKAKELRPFVERIITIAKRGIAKGDANGGSLHARRLVLRDITNRDVVAKLFDTIAPRFEARPGGYTRILRLGYRRGDSAEVAQIELVGSEFNPNAETDKKGSARSRSRRAWAGACAPRPSVCAARRRRKARRAKAPTHPPRRPRLRVRNVPRAAGRIRTAKARRRRRRARPAAHR